MRVPSLLSFLVEHPSLEPALGSEFSTSAGDSWGRGGAIELRYRTPVRHHRAKCSSVCRTANTTSPTSRSVRLGESGSDSVRSEIQSALGKSPWR